jgi:hypothetical protein
MRVLDRLLKPTVARLVAERIEEERLDALYRYGASSSALGGSSVWQKDLVPRAAAVAPSADPSRPGVGSL